MALAAALLAVPAWRIWDTWPAVDRHDDTRPVEWLNGLTRGLGANGLLLADINWQLDNGLDYYVRHVRPDLNVARVTDRVLTLPLLVHDNLAAGNEVVMTPESRRIAEAAYGGLFTFAPDPRVDVRPLADRLDNLPADTIYVLALLAPYRDLPFDAPGLGRRGAPAHRRSGHPGGGAVLSGTGRSVRASRRSLTGGRRGRFGRAAN